MTDSIGAVIVLEGEKEFKKAVTGINQDISVLASEMSKVTAEFGRNANSMDALKSKTEVFNKQIDAQKQKVETLKTALENSKKEYGENSTQVKNWQLQLNKAETQLANTKTKLKQNETAIKEYGQEQVKAALNSKEFSAAQDKLKASLNVVKMAAVAALASIGALTMAAVKNADEIQKQADVTGLSAERLQELQYIGNNLGVELDTITGAQAKLTKAMFAAEAGTGAQAEAFRALGISVVDGNGQLRDAKVVMSEAFTALNGVGNETERDALAMQLFGKSAMELNPLIKAGGDELNRYAKEARASGAVMSNEAIAGLDAFGDALENLKTAVIGKFGQAFADAGLAQKFADFAEKIKNIDIKPLVDGLSWVLDHASGIAAGVVAIGVGLAMFKVASFISSLITAFQGLSTAITAARAAQTGLNIAMLANPIGIIIALIAAAVAAIIVLWNTNEGFRNAVTGAWTKIKETAMDLFTTVKDIFTVKIPGAFNTVLNFVKENWQVLLTLITNPFSVAIKVLDKLIPKFKQWVSGLLAKFKEWINGFSDIGQAIVDGVWAGIQAARARFVANVKNFFKSIVNAVKETLGIASPSKVFTEIGGFMAQGIGEGFTAQMGQVSNLINRSIPTNIEMSGVYNVNSAASKQQTTAAASSSPTVINIYADKELSKVYDLFNGLQQARRQVVTV